MNKWKILRAVISILLLVIAVWQFYPYLEDLKKLHEYRDRFSALWIAVAIVAQGAQYATEGFAIKELLSILGFGIDRRDTVRISALDIFADHVLPMGQFGSLGAFVYFYRKLGVGTDAILYLNVSSSLASVCVLALLFLLSSLSLHSPTPEVPTDMALLDAGAAVVAVLFVTVVLVLGSSHLRKSLDSSLQRLSWYLAFRKSVEGLQDLNGRVLEQRWRYLALAIGKAFCFYAFDILILRSCLLALGASVSLPLLVVAFVTSLAAGLISLLPGGLGATDATLGIIFLSAQVDSAVVVGAILLYRVVSYLLPIPVGAAAYLSLNADLEKRSET